MQQDADARVTTEEAEGREEEEEEAINPMAAVQEDVDAQGAGADAGGAAEGEPREGLFEEEPAASPSLRGARERAEEEVAGDV